MPLFQEEELSSTQLVVCHSLTKLMLGSKKFIKILQYASRWRFTAFQAPAILYVYISQMIWNLFRKVHRLATTDLLTVKMMSVT